LRYRVIYAKLQVSIYNTGWAANGGERRERDLERKEREAAGLVNAETEPGVLEVME